MKKKVLIFGNGYVAKILMQKLNKLGWSTYCTSRKVTCKNKNGNVTIINFLDPELPSIIKSSDIILSTVPPDDGTVDPILQTYAEIISKEKFAWIGYLSSTSVYGDHQGAWVDEATECAPSNEKSRIRLLAEQQWLELYFQYKLPVHILRLSGIYGPERNCLEDIINGKDFTILKEDQYFSRIHIEDICEAIIASMKLPTPGEIYNISDDEPSRLDIVQQFGASILGKSKLREITLEEAVLSEQAKMFFHDNKKVKNNKIVQKLNIRWKYPNYCLGLLHGCLPYL